MTRRRKTYYGVSIGILMVDSSFRRFVGDIGNAETWPFAVQYKVVRGATPKEMIDLGNSDALERFKAAADELIAEGVDGVATTCGFLALYQRELAEHCAVPVATSALLQVPMVERLLPEGRRVGVLTYSATSLTPEHLRAAGAAPDTPVGGLPRGSEFFRWIMDGEDEIPFETLEAEAVGAAERLVAAHPGIGAIVSECTNLTPFSAEIARAVGLPVYDMVSLLHWFHAGLRPRRFVQG